MQLSLGLEGVSAQPRAPACQPATWAMREAWMLRRTHAGHAPLSRAGRSPGTAISAYVATGQLPASPVQLELGLPQDFGEAYILGKRIGGGSYGVVHLAVNRTTGVEVAVKVMSKSRGKQDRSKTLGRLAQEMSMLMHMQGSPGTLQLVGAYEDAQHVFIVTELCRGGDLETLVEAHGPLPEAACARITHECLKIIADCHSRRMLLGDVKPANFMLHEWHQNPMKSIQGRRLSPGWLKAVDFGCSQIAGNTLLFKRTGTPVFMAPEVFKRSYSLEADLWSLGITLYLLYAGRFPFWATVDQCRSRTVDEVMKAVICDAIPLDYGPWRRMSPEGLALVKRLIARDPARRISAVDALDHPWFQRHGCGGGRDLGDRDSGDGAAAKRSNIVPLKKGSAARPPPPQRGAEPAFYTYSAASVLRAVCL